MVERVEHRPRPERALWAAGAIMMISGILGAIISANNVTHQPSNVEVPQQENPVSIAGEGNKWIWITLAGGLAFVWSGGFGNPMRQEEINPDSSLLSESPQPDLKS